MLYEVRTVGGRIFRVDARDSAEAKRLACRHWGYKPGDYWCGVTTMTARRVATPPSECSVTPASGR